MGQIPKADPASTPRVGFAGEATRGRPIFREIQHADPPWTVEVIPLEHVRAEHAIGRARPRATFEVRAEFTGSGLLEFGPAQPAHRVEAFTTPDAARARAIAVSAVEALRAGKEPDLIAIAARFPLA